MRCLVALALLAGGCTRSPSFLEPEGRTMILAVESGGALSLTVVDEPGGNSPIYASGNRVRALFYDATPASLRLEVGRMEEASDGIPLPLPDAAYEATPASESWRKLDVLPDDLLAVRVSVRDPCVDFELRSYPVTGLADTDPHVGARFGAQHAIMQAGVQWVIASAEEAMVDDRLPAFWASQMHYDEPSGETWIFGDGIAYAGSPEAGFRQVPAVPERPIAVTGRPDQGDSTAPFELFALTASIAVWRFDGVAWAEVWPEVDNIPTDGFGAIGWLGPGSVVTTSDDLYQIFEYAGGVRRRVDLVLIDAQGNPDRLRYFRWLKAWGLVLGSHSGVLVRQTGAGWETFARPPSRAGVSVIEAIDGGILFGGRDGVLNQLHPDNKVCEAVQYGLYSDQQIRALVPIDDGFLLLEGAPIGSQMVVMHVRRKP